MNEDAARYGLTRLQPVLSIAAIVLGLGLLTGAGLIWVRIINQPAPYHYILAQPVAADDLGTWSELAKQSIVVRQASIKSANGQQLVSLEVAETKVGPVLIDWQPTVDPPFLNMPPPASAITALASVLRRHVTKKELVLAWWDTSRQLGLLTAADYAFNERLGIPLFVSPQWSRQRALINQTEEDFWGRHADEAKGARFRRFVHALLADERTGIAELHALTSPRKSVLILHARDMLLLGQLAPDKVGVALRDFPDNGDVHKVVPAVKDWLRRNHYPAYTVVRPDGNNTIRAIALTDQASGNTLAARLLPFIGNDQSAVPGTVLVYKTGGFWVYELEPVAKAASSGEARSRDLTPTNYR